VGENVLWDVSWGSAGWQYPADFRQKSGGTFICICFTNQNIMVACL